ncbi:transposase [Methanobrevibacter smithii]|uniref:transposase n=2 Tax=Methanobrevibacter smithii TaxID=2173 RepID=UPI0037DCEC80
MVLRDDTINQTMLVPMDLRNLIPEDHPCYFIKNVVDQIDCSQANRVFADKPGEFAYPRELLLRLILMSVFDGGLSSREIERKTRTDIAYMYLAGMQHPSYRTIARFKVDYPDLIDESFKTTIKIAKEEALVKIHHVSLDGTKIKAKTSMNKLTNEQQLKIMKQHLKESIELDEEEDMELGEESGNGVPETLTDYITNNPTDYYELIPLMEQVQSNLSEIYDETPVNYQVSADNGYSTDMNTEYLEQNGFDGYISSRKLSREQKKYNLSDKPFAKDNFFYDNEMMTYICPLGQPLYKISEYTYKNKSRISHWTKECKTYPMQLFCSKGNRCRVIQDYKIPSKIRMQRKMETPEAKERYKIRSKTAERPFVHLKQNMHLTEFRTTGLQEVNTEFKLYTIGHNLKRIYNEIRRKNN